MLMVANRIPVNTKRELSVYQQVKRKSLPLIDHFQSDLLEHDRGWFRKNPGVPFLHWTKASCGTDLGTLFGAESEVWPKAGEVVPFLFGRSKREHILRTTVTMAQCRAKWPKETALVLHFDGRKLREISCVDAVEIAVEHERRVLREWKSRQCRCGSCNDVKWQ